MPQVVALLLITLAAAAVFWPREPVRRGGGTLVVLLPEPDPRRQEALASLTSHLASATRMDLRLHVVRSVDDVEHSLANAAVVLVPDGIAIGLSTVAWQPLATGRRRVPWNLRPTSVMLSRTTAPETASPWVTHPTRTVFGDSLSLVCRVPLCAGVRASTAGVAWGCDPYDHGAVLVAAALGAFDYAVVRQWDAQAAFNRGRLEKSAWRVTTLSEPLPDITVLAAKSLPHAVRLDLQQALIVLGRELDPCDSAAQCVVDRLGLLGLEGFNLLLGPDFERVRRRHAGCWPLNGR